MQGVPKAEELVFVAGVKLSFGEIVLRNKEGSSELASALPVGGQCSSGVDVEIGAARGEEEEEKTEGLSEDCVSESHLKSEKTGA